MDHPADTPSPGVHCMSSHTANYTSCRVYQNLVCNRQKLYSNRKQNCGDINRIEYCYQWALIDLNNFNRFKMLFAETVKPYKVNENSRLGRLEKMIENLMMSMLIAKKCK